MGFKFENLIVWESAVELATTVSNMIDLWPKKEIFVLSSQICK